MTRRKLSEDEWEIINEQRKQRIREAQQLGGKTRGAQIKNAFSLANEGKPEKKKRVARKPRTTVPPRNPEAHRRGGLNLAKKIREVGEAYDAMVKPEAEYGYVFGMNQKQEESLPLGALRDDIVCELRPARIGIISDAHWPFHDLRKDSSGHFYGGYITALDSLKEAGIDALILNGDMMDLFHLSKHEKIEAKRNWKWELDVSRAMLKHIREHFGDKVRIIYREGNHEERFKRYIASKAKELEDSIFLDEMLDLRNMNIEWVQARAKMKAGKLYIDHGHEYFGGGQVNPSRSYLLKTFDNIVLGHVHKKSESIVRRPLDGSYVQAHTIGCLCDLNPHYAPRNQWTHGFGIIELDKSGDFTLHNKIIMNGQVI